MKSGIIVLSILILTMNSECQLLEDVLKSIDDELYKINEGINRIRESLHKVTRSNVHTYQQTPAPPEYQNGLPTFNHNEITTETAIPDIPTRPAVSRVYGQNNRRQNSGRGGYRRNGVNQQKPVSDNVELPSHFPENNCPVGQQKDVNGVCRSIWGAGTPRISGFVEAGCPMGHIRGRGRQCIPISDLN